MYDITAETGSNPAHVDVTLDRGDVFEAQQVRVVLMMSIGSSLTLHLEAFGCQEVDPPSELIPPQPPRIFSALDLKLCFHSFRSGL